jgi:hypothetical protein
MRELKAVTMAQFQAAILKLAIVLFTLSAGTVLWAVVLTVLWGWFVVPLGVPSINAAEAFGLAIVVGMFRRQPEADLKHGIVAYCVRAFLVSSITALLFLGLGGITYLLV